MVTPQGYRCSPVSRPGGAQDLPCIIIFSNAITLCKVSYTQAEAYITSVMLNIPSWGLLPANV